MAFGPFEIASLTGAARTESERINLVGDRVHATHSAH
jgi:hypothetical protein